MPVNDGQFLGWPFVNHSMEVRGTRTERGSGRQTIVYPRRKFTYIVEFAINPRVIQANQFQTDLLQFLNNGRIYATMRSIDHPKPSFQTEKLRSYNKDVIVPMKTEYQPAMMSFHDDNSSIAMALWQEIRAFYQYEGRLGRNVVDQNQPNSDVIRGFRNGNALTNARPSFGNQNGQLSTFGEPRTTQTTLPSMGMTLKEDAARHFFDSIVIYDLGSDPDSVNIYSYMYPMVNSLDHDNLDYEDRQANVGVSMTFDYEGYYQLIGVNNAQFHQIIEDHLGFRPAANSPRVAGHARMATRGTAGPLVSNPAPVSPGVTTDPGIDPSTLFPVNPPLVPTDIAQPGDLDLTPITSGPIPQVQTTTLDPVLPVDPTDIGGFPTGVIGPPPA